jgi:hypothetical protein
MTFRPDPTFHASPKLATYRNQPERNETVPDSIEECPLCGSRKVEKSGPLVRPINWERLHDQFMFGFVMAECECSQCGNWWSQPAGCSIIETAHRDHGSRHARPPS